MALTPMATPSTVDFARKVLAARHTRYQAFPDIGFADAEWGILLDLFVAAEEGRPAYLSNLVVASGVPKTTALRAIDDLINADHVVREQDPTDGRRIQAYLTPEVHARLYQLIRRMMAHFGLL